MAGRRARRWWSGYTAIELGVPAGTASHRLRWSKGRFTMVDHVDVVGERILHVLGGERCLCFDVLDAWRLGVGGSGLPRPKGRLDELDEARRSFDRRYERALVRRGPGPATSADASALRLRRRWLQQVVASFPPALRARLEAAQLVAAARRVAPSPGEVDARYDDLLDRFVRAAFLTGFAAAGAEPVPDPFAVACWTPSPGLRPDAAGRLGRWGGFAGVTLDRCWVEDVAARGIAAVGDAVVVELVDARRRDVLDVRVCRWRPAPGLGLVPDVSAARVVRDGDGWSLGPLPD
ncbi:MAG: hypothetical protein S0880_14935 [Actinomycetota bacterium]|nr:hypothetical protein [Actinomycetota bacterium]